MLLGIVGPFQIIFLLILLIPFIFLPVYSMIKIYQKAGKPGWTAIVPIYNIIIFMDIIDKPRWWTILWLIPFLNIIWSIWSWNLMVKKFGKDVGFTIGVILLGIVFIPILGLGDAKFKGKDLDSFS